MATTERPHRPLPFLSWKGMRRWSVGRRAPALCRLVVTKAESSGSSLTSKLASLAAMASLLRQATAPSSSSSSSVPVPPCASPSISSSSSRPSRAAAAAAARAGNSPAQAIRSGRMRRCTSVSSNSSRLAGAAAMANCSLRRHSDAIAPATARVTASLSRFSMDSALPYYPPSRSNNEETRPNISRLGTPSHERPPPNPNPSMGSPIVAKVMDTCAHLVHTAVRRSSTRHPLDLLVGNPFLTRLNPAPVSSSVLLHSTNHGSGPSSGLLNASKARHSQLNDRLVFFL